MLMKLRGISLLLAMFLSLLCLAACKKEEDAPSATETPIIQSNLDRDPLPEDTTDYFALLENAFVGLTEPAASELLYEVQEETVKITGYYGTAEKLRLPETVDGLPVTAIGDQVFLNHSELHVLSIPNSVTAFGKEVLKGCNELYALKTPLPEAENGTYLGYLYGATGHETNNVSDLRNLKYLEIGGVITELPSYALYDCNDLVAVKLPETVKCLASYSMYRCESLKFVTTEHLTSIAAHAMDYCISLETLILPSGMQTIGVGAFENCVSLRRLTLPFVGGSRTENTYLGYVFGASTYGFSAGFYPTGLEWVTVTDGIDKLGDHAFYDCDSLWSVSLPLSVTSIGTRAFSGCERIREVQLSPNLLTVGDVAFAGCTRLGTVDLGTRLQRLGVNAFLNCTSLSQIALPATLTVLPNSCFHGCTALKTVDLGGVITVEKNAFHGCTALEQIAASDQIKFEDGNEAAETLLKE